jgi:hypothetical protein
VKAADRDVALRLIAQSKQTLRQIPFSVPMEVEHLLEQAELLLGDAEGLLKNEQ